jgi:predicted lactoylglutathione lyase
MSIPVKQIWANLAVSDTARTAAFYAALGLKSNLPSHSDDLASFTFGGNQLVIHFFKSEKLQPNMYGPLADLSQGCEIIFSIAAETEQEVKDWEAKVRNAGGTILKEPGRDEAGYYQCVFSDPDGHKFNILLMDRI